MNNEETVQFYMRLYDGICDKIADYEAEQVLAENALRENLTTIARLRAEITDLMEKLTFPPKTYTLLRDAIKEIDNLNIADPIDLASEAVGIAHAAFIDVLTLENALGRALEAKDG